MNLATWLGPYFCNAIGRPMEVASCMQKLIKLMMTSPLSRNEGANLPFCSLLFLTWFSHASCQVDLEKKSCGVCSVH
jgi:hypothetical protein